MLNPIQGDWVWYFKSREGRHVYRRTNYALVPRSPDVERIKSKMLNPSQRDGITGKGIPVILNLFQNLFWDADIPLSGIRNAISSPVRDYMFIEERIITKKSSVGAAYRGNLPLNPPLKKGETSPFRQDFSPWRSWRLSHSRLAGRVSGLGWIK